MPRLRPGGRRRLPAAPADVRGTWPVRSGCRSRGGNGDRRLCRADPLRVRARMRGTAARGPRSRPDRASARVGRVVATGAIGSAIAASLLAGACDELLLRSVGVAASQVTGRKTAQGRPLGSYLVGRAAANGYLAFLLAREGLTAPGRVSDADRGYLRLLTDHVDASPLHEAWGKRWYLLELGDPPSAPPANDRLQSLLAALVTAVPA